MNTHNDPSTTVSYSTLKRVVEHSCVKSGVLNGCSHKSNCAVHNEPAHPNEPRDCGHAKRTYWWIWN